MSGGDVIVPPEVLEEFRESFKLFDSDGDGRVTKDELRVAMRNMGQNPTEAELDNMMEEVDTDGSGTIELCEYIQMMVNRVNEVDEEAELRRSFRVFDKDGNGFISLEELTFAMTRVGEKMDEAEVKAMLHEADLDGDGQINYEEFVKMMTAK